MSVYTLSIGAAFFCYVAIYLAIGARIEAIHERSRARRKEIFNELGIVDQGSKKIVGFFHPYCNAGGGGEHVLWAAIALMQRTERDVLSVVYSGDTDATKEQILAKVKSGFDIELLPSSVHFVFLKKRYLIEDKTWPRFTMLGQSIGSMFLAWEAMNQLIPNLFIDTMGYAFTFHVVNRVGRIPRWHTNSDAVSTSSILSQGKLLYYRLFMYYYSYSLRQASFIMVNSSWTKGHIDYALRYEDKLLDLVHFCSPLTSMAFSSLHRPTHLALSSARVVSPSCDTRGMAQYPLEGRERVILSIAQFRPEKDHQAQLHAFHKLLENHPEYTTLVHRVRLVLIGGSRNAEDARRVEGLQSLARTLGISDQVQFIVNAPYPEMLEWLSKASIGLSTMVDEHFGINVVEYMAAGLIPVTHASGGPLNDIVVPFEGQPTGLHATTPKTFAQALHEVLILQKGDELAMRLRARTWAVQRFSEEEFNKGWTASEWKNWLR